MKKLISFILAIHILFLPTALNANGSVNVSAIVGNINQPPTIISVNPNGDPWILETNEIQNYTIYFKDTEKDTVYYTITPGNNSGFVNPISGVIKPNNYDSNKGVYINFLYLAPSIANENATVTITLNDGPNITSKKLNLYIY